VSVERKTYINMAQYGKKVTAAMLEEAAAAVESAAVNLAPVDTGNMKNSMYRKMNTATEAEVGNTAEYAAYQEFGTGDMGAGGGRKWTYFSDKLQQFVTTSGSPAQPFLRPALDFVAKRLDILWKAANRRAYAAAKR